MTSKAQKEREKRCVESFCQCLGIKPIIPDDNKERPDFRVNVNGKIIGVEVTDHFNDETGYTKSSPGMRFLDFWKKTNNKCKELKKGRGLDNVHVYVSLDEVKLKNKRLNTLIDGIAENLISFVCDETSEVKSEIIIIPPKDEIFEKTYNKRDFRGFVYLREYVDMLRITRNDAFFHDWDSSIGACYMGINANVLADKISQKNEKAKGYDTGNINELWLLIAAAHNNSFSAMRIPDEEVDNSIFCRPKIIEACKTTPFNKIFFFANRPDDNSKAWFRQIWPSSKQDRQGGTAPTGRNAENDAKSKEDSFLGI